MFNFEVLIQTLKVYISLATNGHSLFCYMRLKLKFEPLMVYEIKMKSEPLVHMSLKLKFEPLVLYEPQILVCGSLYIYES